MALAFLHPPFRADQASACELLGHEAPLARALGRLSEAFDQLAVSVAIVGVASLWLAAGEPGGAELVIAGTVVVVAVGCRTALLIFERNELMLELIIRGGEDVRLDAVARLRRRLLDPRARRRLARTIAATCVRAAQPAFVGGVPVSARVIDAVEHELEQVIGLLTAERASARGVARAYRLVSGPGSPLYGHDVLALREELNQIRFLLEAGS